MSIFASCLTRKKPCGSISKELASAMSKLLTDLQPSRAQTGIILAIVGLERTHRPDTRPRPKMINASLAQFRKW